MIFSPSRRAQSPQDRHRGTVRARHLHSKRGLHLIPGRETFDKSKRSVDTDLANPAARKLGMVGVAISNTSLSDENEHSVLSHHCAARELLLLIAAAIDFISAAVDA